MRKLRTSVVFIVALAVGLAIDFGPATVPAEASHSAPEQCSGYTSTASYITAAGNVYQSRTNVCLGINPYTTTNATFDGVVRKQCFRNGIPYGDGTGGCRWTNRVELHYFDTDDNTWKDIFSLANEWCVTCGGTYVQDSGRHWTGSVNLNSSAWNDAGASRSKSEGGQVRIYLADGSTRLLNESSVYSKEIFVP